MSTRRFHFVGEKPSRRALHMGVTWRDGRLAAKSLFDALRVWSVDPLLQSYDNWLHADGTPDTEAPYRAMAALAAGYTVVSLGRLADRALTGRKLPHLSLIHPAARGAVRKKERYARHVGVVLALCPVEAKDEQTT